MRQGDKTLGETYLHALARVKAHRSAISACAVGSIQEEAPACQGQPFNAGSNSTIEGRSQCATRESSRPSTPMDAVSHATPRSNAASKTPSSACNVTTSDVAQCASFTAAHPRHPPLGSSQERTRSHPRAKAGPPDWSDSANSA